MSDDPSQVDTETLLVSIRRDIATARAKLIEAWRFLDMAVVAAWELEGRAQAAKAASPQAEGGRARAASMTPKQRHDQAQRAARARWDRREPKPRE